MVVYGGAMRPSRTTTKIVIAGACLAVVVAVVVLLTRGGPPDSLAAAIAPKAGAPTPSWTFSRTRSNAQPRALATDARGHVYVLSDDERFTRDGWELRHEGADGLLHLVAREASQFRGPDLDSATIAVDAHGVPVVAWETADGHLYTAIDGHESRIATTGATSLGRIGNVDPALATTTDGGVVLAWTTADKHENFHAWVAERRPGSVTFDKPRALGRTLELPSVLADRAGGVTVVWNNLGDLKATSRPRGGSFSAPVALGTDGADDATAAIGPDGRVVVVWDGYGHGVWAAQRPAGRVAFEKPVTLFGDHGVSRWPKVAIDDRRGDAIIAWQQQETDMIVSGRGNAAIVRWPAGGKPQAPRRLSDAGNGHQFDPWVLATPGGPVVVIASTPFGADNGHPFVAVMPTGRRVVLAGAQRYPVLGSGPSGLVAAWSGGGEVGDLDLGRLHG